MAFKLMKSGLQRYVKIMYKIEQPSLSWYTNEIDETKSPRHGFQYSLRMAAGGWTTERHLQETLDTLMTQDALRFMEISLGEKRVCRKSFTPSVAHCDAQVVELGET